MSRVLVTGGAGFIPSHVAAALTSRGYEAIVLDDFSGGFLDNVCHLAACAADGLSHFIKPFNDTNTLIASVNLLIAAINTGVKCFVFTSIAVHGTGPDLPMTEETRPEPGNSHGHAKYAVECQLRARRETR